MLKLRVQWVLFEPILDLLKYIGKDGLRWVVALELIHNFEKWRFGDPIVDPD